MYSCMTVYRHTYTCRDIIPRAYTPLIIHILAALLWYIIMVWCAGAVPGKVPFEHQHAYHSQANVGA